LLSVISGLSGLQFKIGFVDFNPLYIWNEKYSVYMSHSNVSWTKEIDLLTYIYGHNTEYVYNNKYTWTINIILAKYCLWLPDDGLCQPKHVGATVIILIFFPMALRPNVGHVLILEVSRSHTTTQHSR
jgi:hypothetical protein